MRNTLDAVVQQYIEAIQTDNEVSEEMAIELLNRALRSSRIEDMITEQASARAKFEKRK